MKLTSDQIDKIQSSLSTRNIFYDDIRAELVDHFATEIEEKMEGSKSFDLLLLEKLSRFNQKKFQRALLLQTHLGMLKGICNKMLSFRLILKVVIMTCLIGFWINVFSNTYPDFAEIVLKISFLIAFTSVALLGLIRTRLLKNSRIVAAGNTLFMLAIISHLVLRLDLLQWTGITNQNLLYGFTFWFCLLLVSGFRVLSNTAARAQLI